MADKSIILRSVEGAALNATQNDQNLDSLAGVVDAQTGTTYTVLYTDQNKTIELNNASMVCTLSAISTIAAAIQSSKWKVTLKNINATAAEVKNNAADTIDGTDYSSTGISLKQYEAITLQINNAGTGWIIIGDKFETFASIDVNGGDIDGVTIDSSVIGGSTAAAGTFTTIKADTSLELATGATVTGILDEDAMGSDSDTQLATQQSIKAYVDTNTATYESLVTLGTTGTETLTTTIPTGTNKVEIVLYGVSTDGTDQLLLQVGYTGPTYITSGYVSNAVDIDTNESSTAGVNLVPVVRGAGYIYSGKITLDHLGSNIWLITGLLVDTGGTKFVTNTCGYIDMSANVLSALRIDLSGANVFDGGVARIHYYG